MIKRICILWILGLFLAQAVLAEQVVILNLHYKDGGLTLTDKAIMDGYHPDRKIQPGKGYRTEMISDGNEVLHAFRFEVPLKIYADVSDEDGISGGLFLLNETDFALTYPHYDHAKEIKFYNEKGTNVLEVGLADKGLLTKGRIIAGV